MLSTASNSNFWLIIIFFPKCLSTFFFHLARYVAALFSHEFFLSFDKFIMELLLLQLLTPNFFVTTEANYSLNQMATGLMVQDNDIKHSGDGNWGHRLCDRTVCYVMYERSDIMQLVFKYSWLDTTESGRKPSGLISSSSFMQISIVGCNLSIKNNLVQAFSRSYG